MFGKQQWHYVGYYGKKGDNEIETSDIVNSVYNDIKRRRKSASKADMVHSLTGGYFDSYMDEECLPGRYDNFKEMVSLDLNKKEDQEKFRQLSRESQNVNHKRALAIVETFMSINKGKYIIVTSYADEDGEWGGMMEHSGIFHRLEHIRTSCH